MRSWAPRSFYAETMFMALVICWVFLTAAILRLISCRVAMLIPRSYDALTTGWNTESNSSRITFILASISEVNSFFSLISASKPAYFYSMKL